MIWDTILAIKESLKKYDSPCRFLSVSLTNNLPEVLFNSIKNDESMVIDFTGLDFNVASHVMVNGPFAIEMKENKLFCEEDARIFTTYLPYALLPYFSRKNKKCYAVAHFAQTLDGRIASASGDSKWIGNQENLIHAHKMRALCDAILIGARTLHNDNPRLNVRLVKGHDPAKVIVGGDNLDLEDYTAIDCNTIIFGHNHFEFHGDLCCISLKKNHNQFKPEDLLNVLFKRGIHSVYIEGGSYTTSVFLKQRAVDQVQVHITPKIMGSGIVGFQFDGLNSVSEAIGFRCHRFVPMGDHMMFIGELNGKP